MNAADKNFNFYHTIFFMKSSQSIPKKIQINSARKSTIGRESLVSPRIQQYPTSVSQFPNANTRQKELNERVDKLTKQVSYYREKHDESLIKVRFLTDKLKGLGVVDKVPQDVQIEIGETDKHILKLEQLLNYKRSYQMKILKKRIKQFVEALYFEVQDSDLDSLTNQVQIIYFMKDLFIQRYKQLAKQRNDVDVVMQKLREDTVFNREKLEQQIKQLGAKNQELSNYVKNLQIQIINLKKQQSVNKNVTKKGIVNDQFYHNLSPFAHQYDENIRKLQFLNEQLISQIKDIDGELEKNEFLALSLKKKLEQSDKLLTAQKVKNRQLMFELQRVRKYEQIWKERYRILQEQKNNKIKSLEAQNRKLNSVRGRKNTKMTQQDEVVENQSGEQHYQLAEAQN